MTVLRMIFYFLAMISSLMSLNLKAHDWVEHKPGGDTLCGRGEEFSFFVHEGTNNDKVIIDFIGGGACWNGKNCSLEGTTFVDSVDVVREHQQNGIKGIYDHLDPRNPVKDWTHVVIPYCTGDIHWGENDQTYVDQNGTTFPIYHRGAINTKAVLNWVEENLPNPEKLLVTGCSAGAYGSIYWTPHLKKIYPNTKITQFGDSGTGVITNEFLEESLRVWQSTKNAPTWIEGLDPKNTDWKTLGLNSYYTQVAKAHPEIRFNQFSYTFDETQSFFYELMGGNFDVFPQESQNRLESLKNGLPNFDFVLTEGDEHCILPYERLHTDKGLDGRKFLDWFKELL
jgi:hypothetical protein